MKKHKVGLCGYGWVGKAMHNLFPDAIVYDTQKVKVDTYVKDINALRDCEFVFVNVPTPPKPNGQCDTSIVEEVCRTILSNNQDTIVIIRSTVEVGTTEKLNEELSLVDDLGVRQPGRVVFQPEYLGETQMHPMLNMKERSFVILGGEDETVNKVADLYKSVYNADVYYYFTNSRTAELCKYMENSYLATKVTFVNEFYDIARTLGCNFNHLRELWLADPRVGRSHTDVYPNKRGFSGKCLPKDTKALVYKVEEKGGEAPLMKTIIKINQLKYGNE